MQTLPLADAELAAWLRLTTMPQLSAAAARALLGAFGMPQQIFAATHIELAGVVGGRMATRVLKSQAPDFATRQATLHAWLAQPGNQLVTLADPAYPRALFDSDSPPLLLYVSGRLELLHRPALAIVGSRHASQQGMAVARAFARELGVAGLTVVSGLALGIDEAAHWGALPTLGGTVAFMGTGADLIYPTAHRQLAHELATHGALVSEWPLGTPPRRNHFPQRNRLIAALTRGVLVVEAAAQSGSLITARLANEIGRDVYAIPGSIHSALTKGCHRLIKEGAKLVETVTDILDELDWPAPVTIGETSAQATDVSNKDRPMRSQSGTLANRNVVPPCSENAHKVLQILGHDPAVPDLLAERSGLSTERLQAALLELELTDRIVVLPCGRIERQVAILA